MTARHSVFVVVDKEYGERLRELAPRGAVWIIDTPQNRAAAQKLWAAPQNASQLDGVTTFKSEATSPEKAFLNALDTVDLHHGSHSSAPPYTELEVIGALLTEQVKSKLRPYGFAEFSSTPSGFRAASLAPLAKSRSGIVCPSSE